MSVNKRMYPHYPERAPNPAYYGPPQFLFNVSSPDYTGDAIWDVYLTRVCGGGGSPALVVIMDHLTRGWGIKGLHSAFRKCNRHTQPPWVALHVGYLVYKKIPRADRYRLIDITRGL